MLPFADDQLKKLFPGTKTDMFKMQKLLSRHCKTNGEAQPTPPHPQCPSGPAPCGCCRLVCSTSAPVTVALPFAADVVVPSDEEEEEDEEAKPKPKPKPAPKKARRSSSADVDGAPRKAGGFTKQCRSVQASMHVS